MSKLTALRTSTPQGTGAVLASGNPAIINKLAGKSLFQVGSEFDLNDNDVDFVKTGTDIVNLWLKIDGQEVLCAVSRNFPMERLNDADYLLNCEFRAGYRSVKAADGVTPEYDENGAIILDESKPYLSFGKPSGIVVTEHMNVFATPTVEQRAGGPKAGAPKAGAPKAGAPKAAVRKP